MLLINAILNFKNIYYIMYILYDETSLNNLLLFCHSFIKKHNISIIATMHITDKNCILMLYYYSKIPYKKLIINSLCV